jgi:hypothetical protein
MTNIIIKERIVSYGIEVGWATLAGFILLAAIGVAIYFSLRKRNPN